MARNTLGIQLLPLTLTKSSWGRDNAVFVFEPPSLEGGCLPSGGCPACIRGVPLLLPWGFCVPGPLPVSDAGDAFHAPAAVGVLAGQCLLTVAQWGTPRARLSVVWSPFVGPAAPWPLAQGGTVPEWPSQKGSTTGLEGCLTSDGYRGQESHPENQNVILFFL